MRINRILLVCSALALPQVAMAGAADINPKSLGIVHAILQFCSQVDSRNAGSFQAEWQSVVGRTSERKLDTLEEGGAYKQGYDMTMALLKGVSKQDAAASCATGAAQWGQKNSKEPATRHDVRPEPREHER